MSVTDTSPDWTSLQGVTLDGGYELKDIVEAERDRAVLRVRVLGDYTLKASASFHVLAPPAAEEEAALWQSVRGFEKKSNVSIPLGAGTIQVNNTRLAYLVLENPEETLADVLDSRALLPEEATDLLRAVARGVGELHANGYVHGCISPVEVRAVRDDIQITIECIRRVHAEPLVEPRPAKYLAPETSTRNLTIASDLWCLGASIFETLTQKKYEPALFDEAAEFKHPFGSLFAACLEPDPEKRCKLADLETILRSKVPPPRPKPVVLPPPPTPPSAAPLADSAKAAGASASLGNGGPVLLPPPAALLSEGSSAPPASPAAPAATVVETKVAPPVVPPASPRPGANLGAGSFEKAPPRASVPAPEYPNQPELSSFRAKRAAQLPADEDKPVGLSRQRGWFYAIGAFLLIFLALWLIRSHSRAGDRMGSAASKTSVASPPAPAPQPGAAWPTKTLTPDGKPAATPERPRATAPPVTREPAASGERTVWRVVLYTYRRQEDAQHKMADINGKRPDLHAEVFVPGGGSGPYLVVAGGGMSRDAATRLRARAVREGMPRDSYIQNYAK